MCIGYCDGVNSIINGSGLNHSVAGELSRFFVFLKDAYLYPSPVELERVKVQIVREFDSSHVQATISPMEMVNGTKISNYYAISNLSKCSSIFTHTEVYIHEQVVGALLALQLTWRLLLLQLFTHITM